MTIVPKMRAGGGERGDQVGPGGVKIVTTDTTGKVGTAGCSFVWRRQSRPRSDAAFRRAVLSRGGVRGQGSKITMTSRVLTTL